MSEPKVKKYVDETKLNDEIAKMGDSVKEYAKEYADNLDADDVTTDEMEQSIAESLTEAKEYADNLDADDVTKDEMEQSIAESLTEAKDYTNDEIEKLSNKITDLETLVNENASDDFIEDEILKSEAVYQSNIFTNSQISAVKQYTHDNFIEVSAINYDTTDNTLKIKGLEIPINSSTIVDGSYDCDCDDKIAELQSTINELINRTNDLYGKVSYADPECPWLESVESSSGSTFSAGNVPSVFGAWEGMGILTDKTTGKILKIKESVITKQTVAAVTQSLDRECTNRIHSIFEEYTDTWGNDNGIDDIIDDILDQGELAYNSSNKTLYVNKPEMAVIIEKIKNLSFYKDKIATLTNEIDGVVEDAFNHSDNEGIFKDISKEAAINKCKETLRKKIESEIKILLVESANLVQSKVNAGFNEIDTKLASLNPNIDNESLAELTNDDDIKTSFKTWIISEYHKKPDNKHADINAIYTRNKDAIDKKYKELIVSSGIISKIEDAFNDWNLDTNVTIDQSVVTEWITAHFESIIETYDIEALVREAFDDKKKEEEKLCDEMIKGGFFAYYIGFDSDVENEYEKYIIDNFIEPIYDTCGFGNWFTSNVEIFQFQKTSKKIEDYLKSQLGDDFEIRTITKEDGGKEYDPKYFTSDKYDKDLDKAIRKNLSDWLKVPSVDQGVLDKLDSNEPVPSNLKAIENIFNSKRGSYDICDEIFQTKVLNVYATYDALEKAILKTVKDAMKDRIRGEFEMNVDTWDTITHTIWNKFSELLTVDGVIRGVGDLSDGIKSIDEIVPEWMVNTYNEDIHPYIEKISNGIGDGWNSLVNYANTQGVPFVKQLDTLQKNMIDAVFARLNGASYSDLHNSLSILVDTTTMENQDSIEAIPHDITVTNADGSSTKTTKPVLQLRNFHTGAAMEELKSDNYDKYDVILRDKTNGRTVNYCTLNALINACGSGGSSNTYLNIQHGDNCYTMNLNAACIKFNNSSTVTFYINPDNEGNITIEAKAHWPENQQN